MRGFLYFSNMELLNKLQEKPSVKKIKKFIPAIAFLGGFAWDSITLGSMVYSSDIFMLLAYYAGALILVILLSAQVEHPEGWTKERLQKLSKAKQNAKNSTAQNATKSAQDSIKKRPELLESAAKIANAATNKIKETAEQAAALAEKKAKEIGYTSNAIPQNAIVVHRRLLDREWSPALKQRFTWAVQFCFGGLFSALVVCYFKSSGSLASLILVVLLAILLVGNEFLQKKYESFGVSLAFFCLLGTMFLNFAIPHIVHRIGFIWFLISSILSFSICIGIWKLSRRKRSILVAPAIISISLIVAYIMNWVPPVPLVLKQKIPCQNFDKTTYSCDIDAPTFLQKIGLKEPSVHKLPNSEVYFVTSVYAPAELKAELQYMWYFQNPNTHKYTLTDKITSSRMVIKGGKETGFRSYTRKKNITPGKWRVEVAYKNGAVIGSGAFEVIDKNIENIEFVRDTLK